MGYKEGDEPAPGYRLTEFLGRGGFGEVWKANAPGGAHAAVKIINVSGKQGRKEFRAIRLVKLLHHPNLVPITALWLKDDDGNFLDDSLADQPVPAPTNTSVRETMQLQQVFGARPAELIIAMGLGEMNLLDRLELCLDEGMQGIPPDELLDYMEDAARGIDYLNSPRHDLGSGPQAIQHCDIKPQNIMIVGGAAQVCDFGLARTLSDTRVTSVAGSPAYGAPECLKGELPSPTTDQYSLAISYFELRTGVLPFDDESLMGVINAHTQGRLNLTKLPDPERVVIQRATALDPRQRFESTVKMVRALRRAYEGSMISQTRREQETWRPPEPEQRELAEGMQLVPGITLKQRLVHSAVDEVWEAEHDDRKVALVVRDLTQSNAVVDLRAVALAERLRHPHLTKLLNYWLLDAHLAVLPPEAAMLGKSSGPVAKLLVMAGKLADKTLLRQLEDYRTSGEDGIPIETLLIYMTELAGALDFLNRPQHKWSGDLVSIAHQNVRPVNMVLEGDRVKLGNYGLVRLLEGEQVEIPHDGISLAHAFVAPEVLGGKLSRYSDQYSLAISYVQLRTGSLPFDTAHSTTQLVKSLSEHDLDLTRLEPGEAAVIGRATNKDPQARYPTCEAMVEALGQATNGLLWVTPTIVPKMVSKSSSSEIRVGDLEAGGSSIMEGSEELSLAGDSPSALPIEEPSQPVAPAKATIRADSPEAAEYRASQGANEPPANAVEPSAELSDATSAADLQAELPTPVPGESGSIDAPPADQTPAGQGSAAPSGPSVAHEDSGDLVDLAGEVDLAGDSMRSATLHDLAPQPSAPPVATDHSHTQQVETRGTLVDPKPSTPAPPSTKTTDKVSDAQTHYDAGQSDGSVDDPSQISLRGTLIPGMDIASRPANDTINDIFNSASLSVTPTSMPEVPRQTD